MATFFFFINLTEVSITITPIHPLSGRDFRQALLASFFFGLKTGENLQSCFFA